MVSHLDTQKISNKQLTHPHSLILLSLGRLGAHLNSYLLHDKIRDSIGNPGPRCSMILFSGPIIGIFIDHPCLINRGVRYL